ncbi:hypothetical protein NKDENANG_01427 [Candidatus Entotheonellaceae bacterium PAL068K]
MNSKSQESYQNLWTKKRLLHLGWATLGHCVERLNAQIEASAFRPTTIVGIARGGLGLALFLANYHHIQDFYVMAITRNLSDQKFHRGARAQFAWMAPQPATFANKHVLIADDITGDGGTLSLAIEVLRDMEASHLRTAVIAKNVNTQLEPDFHALTVDDWLVFPWERLESVEDMRIEEISLMA